VLDEILHVPQKILRERGRAEGLEEKDEKRDWRRVLSKDWKKRAEKVVRGAQRELQRRRGICGCDTTRFPR